jgi:hypothetical protein
MVVFQAQELSQLIDALPEGEWNGHIHLAVRFTISRTCPL